MNVVRDRDAVYGDIFIRRLRAIAVQNQNDQKLHWSEPRVPTKNLIQV
jgi:hypothetical protein